MLNKTIAELLTTEFASLTTGYEFDVIVTDDIQIYEEKMTIGDKAYIPCIFDVVTSFKNENMFLETFQYRLKFAVKRDYRDDFYELMNSFRESQENEIIGDYDVTKTTQFQTLSGEDTVNGVDYLFYDMILNWTYSLSVSGRNMSFRIKGENEEDYTFLPFVNYQQIHDITYVSNENEGDSYRLTNDTMSLAVPLILSNPKVLELYERINNDTYNAVYDIKIVTGDVEIIKTMALKKGFMNIPKNSGLASMLLTFETHYPRMTITLDGDEIPVVAFKSEKVKGVEPDNADGEDKTYGVPVDITRSFTIKFVKNDTDAWKKLENDHNSDGLDVTYQLVVGSQTYNVTATTTSEMFTDTGDMALEVSFVEVRVD